MKSLIQAVLPYASIVVCNIPAISELIRIAVQNCDDISIAKHVLLYQTEEFRHNPVYPDFANII